MDPLDVLSKMGALGVALYALRQSWADKAEAVKTFAALNEERRQISEKATAAIERAAVAIATFGQKLDDDIRERREARDKDRRPQ